MRLKLPIVWAHRTMQTNKYPSKYQIRRAQRCDIQSIIAFAESLHNQHSWSGIFNKSWKAQYLEETVICQDRICLVCELESLIVGYALACLECEEAIELNRCRLTELWIDEEHRRLGLAGQMLTIILQWADSKHTFEVEVNVGVDNPFKPERLFKSQGFVARSAKYVKVL